MKFINFIFIYCIFSFPVKSDQFDSRLLNLFDELYLSKDNQEFVVAKGGRSGSGNLRFKNFKGKNT